MAVDYVGVQPVNHLNNMFNLSSHDTNVSSTYKQTISSILIKRTGHARFRRGPSSFSTPTVFNELSTTSHQCEDNKLPAPSGSTSSSSISSSLAGGGGLEGSVSNGKRLGIIAPAPAFSSRKPPLPSTHRKRCIADRPVANVHGSGSGCHSCKRRKTGSKREIRRVPIIGSKVTSILADDYSWKKYGEKIMDGSPYPRVYYKCSTRKGCPARKRVELATDDSKMLVITYEGEHRHRHV